MDMKKINGAVKINENNPPSFVALPLLSQGFTKRFGLVSLENIFKLDGSYRLNEAFASDAELAIAEVETHGRRKHYVTRIQLKAESWLDTTR